MYKLTAVKYKSISFHKKLASQQLILMNNRYTLPFAHFPNHQDVEIKVLKIEDTKVLLGTGKCILVEAKQQGWVVSVLSDTL